MNYARPRGPHAQWPTLSEALYNATQQAMLGDQSVEDALSAAADVINPILEEDPFRSQVSVAVWPMMSTNKG